jgi:hypothetical protein
VAHVSCGATTNTAKTITDTPEDAARAMTIGSSACLMSIREAARRVGCDVNGTESISQQKSLDFSRL